MILYDYWRSSSAWRVRIALALKGIPFERRVVNLITDGGEQHARRLPGAQPVAPGARAGRRRPTRPPRITQSMAIIEYLEERFPAPPLLPADAWLRARARQLAEMVNSGIQPLQNLPCSTSVQARRASTEANGRATSSRAASARSKRRRRETAGHLPGRRRASASPTSIWSRSSTPRAASTSTSRRIPTLVRVEAACAALPAFQAAHPDAQSDAVTAKT